MFSLQDRCRSSSGPAPTQRKSADGRRKKIFARQMLRDISARALSVVTVQDSAFTRPSAPALCCVQVPDRVCILVYVRGESGDCGVVVYFISSIAGKFAECCQKRVAWSNKVLKSIIDVVFARVNISRGYCLKNHFASELVGYFKQQKLSEINIWTVIDA